MRVCDFCRKPINDDGMKTLYINERAKMGFSPCDVARKLGTALEDALAGRKADPVNKYELKTKEVCDSCWKKYTDLVIKEVLPKMEEDADE